MAENKIICEDKELEQFRNKLLDIYDVNDLILKLTNNKYQSFIGTDMAIIQYGNGKGCIVDYEGVGKKFDSLDEKLKFDVSEKEEEIEQPDGSTVKAVAMYPYGTIKLSARDIMQRADSHQEEAGDFFSKCYGSNGRCQDNLKEIIDDLKANGYFDSESFVESVSSKYPDVKEVVQKVANALYDADYQEYLHNGGRTLLTMSASDYYNEIMNDIRANGGEDWIETVDGRGLSHDLLRDFYRVSGHYDYIAGHLFADPDEYISKEDCDKLDKLINDSRYRVGMFEDILAKELEKRIGNPYPGMDTYEQAMLGAIDELEQAINGQDIYLEANNSDKFEPFGVKAAKIVYKAFMGECGPFGDKNPKLNGRQVGLWSMNPTTGYTFHDDGSVDVVGKDDNLDGTYDEFNFHYDNVEDFLKSGDDGWFIYFEDEYPEQYEKLLGLYRTTFEKDAIVESSQNKKLASMILYDGTKELTSIDFDRYEDLGSVSNSVVSAIDEYPEADKLVLCYVDDLCNSTRCVNFNNFKKIDADHLEQDLFDLLDDEGYAYWAETIDYDDIEQAIEKAYKANSSYEIDYDDIEQESACIALLACQFLNKPVDLVKSINYNEDGDYIRILFYDNSSRYFYSRGVYSSGIKDKITGTILRGPEDFNAKKVELRSNDQDTFLEDIEGLEENRVADSEFISNTLDNFLQDMAQMYADISYGDISKFEKSITSADDERIKSLKKLYRKAKEAEVDDELIEIASDVEKLVKSNDQDTFLEDYDRITKEDEAWLDKQIIDHGFSIVSKRDYGFKKPLTDVHYQIISNEGNKTEEDLRKEVDWIDSLLETFEGMSGSPCTYSMGLQVDGFISCGFDCRATSDKYKDSLIESESEYPIFKLTNGSYYYVSLDTDGNPSGDEDCEGSIQFFRSKKAARDFIDRIRYKDASDSDTFLESGYPVYVPEVGDKVKYIRHGLGNGKEKPYINKEAEITYCSSLGDFEITFDDGHIIDKCTKWNIQPLEKEPELYHIVESEE